MTAEYRVTFSSRAISIGQSWKLCCWERVCVWRGGGGGGEGRVGAG